MLDDKSLKDELIELCMDRFLKMQFESKTLEEYWCCSMNIFPKLSEKALSTHIPFATTYLCESGFSTFLSIKTKSKKPLECTSRIANCHQQQNSTFSKSLVQ